MIALIVLGAALVMMLVEASSPGRTWPRVSGWWLRAGLLNAIQAGIVFFAGKTWEPWLEDRRLWSADALGVTAGALLGYVTITFVYYWWHRLRHDVPFLWRWLHQVHHSPQRLEILTSFYKHPLEILANSVLSSAVLYLLVGLGPVAAGHAILLTGLAELVYHWNVATPYWMGFFFQRPESHCVHHQAGHHRFNYGDLPLWDMLFGTFRNPRHWSASCGFGAAETRLAEMLCGADVAQRRG